MTLFFRFAAIAAVLAVGCSKGGKQGTQSSQCVTINACGAAVFADDGTWLAALSRIGSNTGSGEPLPTSQTILVCDSDNGHELLKLEKPGQFFSALFPITGKDQLISLGSRDYRLGPQSQLELTYWDCKSGTAIRSATLDPVPDSGLHAEKRFVVSPGGERFYLISQLSAVQRKNMPAELQSAGTLTCWELPKANKQFVISDDAAPKPRLSIVVFTGDGSMMAAICEPRMIVAWDAITGKELHRFTDVDARQLAVNVDGTVLAAATRGKVRCWDLRTGRERASVNVKMPMSENSGRFEGDTATVVGPSIVLCSDGRRLAVCDTRRIIETWDVARGSRMSRCGFDAQVAAGIADVAFNSDGTLLAAVARESTGESFGWRTYDGHLYVWDVANGQLVHHSTFKGGRGSHRLVFRRDSKRLMVVSEQGVTLCHLDAEKP